MNVKVKVRETLETEYNVNDVESIDEAIALVRSGSVDDRVEYVAEEEKEFTVLESEEREELEDADELLERQDIENDETLPVNETEESDDDKLDQISTVLEDRNVNRSTDQGGS